MQNSTLEALSKRHREAGDRYAQACDELRASLVELAALERVLPPNPTHPRQAPADAFDDLRHREFVPRPPQGIRAAVEARAAEIAAEVQ